MKDFINADKILQYIDKKVVLELSKHISEKKDNENTRKTLIEIYKNIPSNGKYILENNRVVSAPIVVQKYIEQYIQNENIISYRDFLMNNIKLNSGRFFYDDQIIVKENFYDRILQNEDFIEDVIERNDGSKDTVRNIIENDVFDLIPEDGKCRLNENNQMNAYQFVKKLYKSGMLKLTKEELKEELIQFKEENSIIEIDIDSLNKDKIDANLIELNFEKRKTVHPEKQKIEKTEKVITVNKEEVENNTNKEVKKEIDREKIRNTYLYKLDLSEELKDKLNKLPDEEKEKLSQALFDTTKNILNDVEKAKQISKENNEVFTGKDFVLKYKNNKEKEEILDNVFNEVFDIETTIMKEQENKTYNSIEREETNTDENKQEKESEENKNKKKINIKKVINDLVEKSGIQIKDVDKFKNTACKCLDNSKTKDEDKKLDDEEKDR